MALELDIPTWLLMMHSGVQQRRQTIVPCSNKVQRDRLRLRKVTTLKICTG